MTERNAMSRCEVCRQPVTDDEDYTVLFDRTGDHSVFGHVECLGRPKPDIGHDTRAEQRGER